MNLNIGGFAPKSEDGRTANDVLVNDLTLNPALAFNVSDFHTAVFGAEYLVGLWPALRSRPRRRPHQSNSVPSVYADFVNDDGSEIEQTLKLRDVPFSATIRFLPLGHNRGGIQPFFGAGASAFTRGATARQAISSTTTVRSFATRKCRQRGRRPARWILGGVRVPIGKWGVGGELRWQSAVGDLLAGQRLRHGSKHRQPAEDRSRRAGLTQFSATSRFLT